MSYVVLARRFRPRNFEEVVGQDHVAATLRHAVAGDRLAHAYLFCGPRGVGKTSMARILAKALNCHKSQGPTPEPCGRCPACQETAEGRSLDVIELDAASHTGVDDVRDLRQGALYSTARDRFKVYIIDEAHMMSRSAFNALLKTLEEPPAHVKFIFATTEPERLPETIRSRCQRFDFRRISAADIRRRLEQIAAGEKLQIEPEALAAIARSSRGGLRDAEGLLDQLVSFRGREKITHDDVLRLVGAVSDAEIGRLLAALAGREAGQALAVLAGCLDSGAELDEVAAALADRIRGALLVAVAGPESALVSGDYGHLVAELKAEAERAGAANLTRMGSILAEARRAMRASPEPRLVLELALVRLAALPDAVDLRALIEKLSALPLPPAAALGPAAARASREPARPNLGPARPLAPDPQPSEPARRSPSPESRTPAPAAADQWPAIRAAVAERQPSLGRLLERCQSAAMEGEVLRLTMSPGSSFSIEQLEQPDKRQLVEEEAARLLGAPVRLAFTLAGAPAGRSGATSPRRAMAPEKTPAAPPPAAKKSTEISQAAEQPAVRKLLSKFDGQVIDVRHKKP